MAAKLLHSLVDDNPDLQKQIGCMTGIFQIFDRQQVLTGRRLTHKRLPPGTSHFQNGSSEGHFNNVDQRQTATETNLNRNVSEKQRLSTESSRASFSSSCSSSLSSLDCGKTAQQEASSFDRIIFPETPSGNPAMQQGSTSPHLGRHSLDLWDVVKDSMYREARGLSVKTAAHDESAGRSLKHKDSPRPFQVSKSGDGSYNVGVSGKQNVPADIKESLRVLAKLREAPWYYNEGRDLSRSQYEVKEGSWLPISKDAHRFSCDGKEMNRLSLDSRDTFKSISKLKEMPRLSLDGRDGSNSDSKPNYLFKKFQDAGISNNKDVNQPQALATQKWSPSIVAKLMGVEAMPDSTSPSDDKFGLIKAPPHEARDPFSRSLKAIRAPNAPRSLMKEPASPRWRNPDLMMKPVSSSKFPIEPAPWRQPDGSRGSQKTAFRPVKVPARTTNSFPSVYSEIEKRLKHLEFKQSGKDLRALKQILEAMQAKGLIESSKEEQASSFGTQKDYELKSSSPNFKSRNQQNMQSNHVIASTTTGSNSSRKFESPIVVMKPAKLVQKSNIPPSSVIPVDRLSSLQKLQSKGSEDSKKVSVNSRAAKDQSPRSGCIDSAVSSSDKKISGKTTRSTMQSSPKPLQLPKESITSSTKSSGSVSPRLQLKKHELDKWSRPPTPPADLSKPRRHSNRQFIESGSSSGRLKQKPHHLQQADDQMSQISNESRTSSHHGDDSSVQSGSNFVLDSRIDIEFASTERCIEINGSQSPSMRAAKHAISSSAQKKSAPSLSEDGPLAELAAVTPEHPSPVSVMDASALRDNDSSPIKQMSNALKGDIAQISSDRLNEDQWNTTFNGLSDSMGSGLTTEISRKKLQNIEHLVQKLRRLNSSHDEAGTDYIASLCENTNPDHRYISEILLASGLLLRDLGSDLTTFQLHPSGHPINPELFFVLEQTNASTFYSKEECSPVKFSHSKTDPQKVHRKLIFNVVNEILVGKLALVGTSPEPWLKTNRLASKRLSAQKLLKELCSEIEQLQAKKTESSVEGEDNDDDLKSILWEDVKNRSGSWTNFDCEISGVVLDVERSLFKDLVDEIVMGEAATLRGKPGRRRKLFVK
ncbi:protein LONGIFOLIA 2-like [Mangifera indica]|uniref:protein LONGIFOLIA 2-like n=1 Tax=Mangifera indica TaxID=29780 RepID=UPI001CF9F265|nr:protein LONGIFOLIA 2-like [Mangifera indica]